jgi:hypothetical protein
MGRLLKPSGQFHSDHSKGLPHEYGRTGTMNVYRCTITVDHEMFQSYSNMYIAKYNTRGLRHGPISTRYFCYLQVLIKVSCLNTHYTTHPMDCTVKNITPLCTTLLTHMSGDGNISFCDPILFNNEVTFSLTQG